MAPSKPLITSPDPGMIIVGEESLEPDDVPEQPVFRAEEHTIESEDHPDDESILEKYRPDAIINEEPQSSS